MQGAVNVDKILHGTDEQLEAYTLGRLSDSEEEILEQHLLVCDSCRNSLDRQLIYASGMREAILDPGPQRDFFAWVRPVFAPRFAMAGALAALVLALGLYFGIGNRVHYAPVAALQLIAVRGETPAIEPAREIDLTLNSFPSSGGPFKAQVVNANGDEVWSGAVTSPALSIHDKFGPGAYFVRLYGADGSLLHEYAFRVEAKK